MGLEKKWDPTTLEYMNSQAYTQSEKAAIEDMNEIERNEKNE